MGYNYDYCGEARSMVYCRSDAAYLCLSCDRNVHSANPLSKCHMRTLVCDACNSQPAVVRCADEKQSLCQNCDWASHNRDNRDACAHNRQTLNCYSGCPSATELSSIWFFMSESCEQEMGSMSIANENKGHDSSVNVETTILEMSNTGADCSQQVVDDGVYDDYTMDEVDMNIENYEEMFGVGHNDPKQLDLPATPMGLLLLGKVTTLFSQAGKKENDNGDEGQAGKKENEPFAVPTDGVLHA